MNIIDISLASYEIERKIPTQEPRIKYGTSEGDKVGKGKKHTNETTNVSTRKENNNAWT